MVTVVNEELYHAFIRHILSDVAERRIDTGEYLPRGRRRSIRVGKQSRRVFVHGDHVCYQNEQFHDSDTEYRLNMAVAAAESVEQKRLGRSWGSNSKACVEVAEALLDSKCERLKNRFLRSDRHPRSQSMAGDAALPSDSPLVRLAQTIRRQVSRYRSRNPDWLRDFGSQLERFRSSHFRDPEWFREVEAWHVRWLSDLEKRLEFEWVEAMRIVSMARLCQERRKFQQAAAIYRGAILITRRAQMNEGLRVVVLAWLRVSVKASLRETRPLPDPVYTGPRQPGTHPRA